MRRLCLCERSSRVVRLGRRDLDCLLAQYAGRIDVTPTHQRGRYCLTSRGYVGVVQLPATRLLIGPKVRATNLPLLLGIESPELTPTTERIDLLELFARLFAVRLRERLAAGLTAGYEERVGIGMQPRGRLDPAAQLREAGRRNRLHFRADEFDHDTPANRLIRAVGEHLARLPLLVPTTRFELRQALGTLAGVSLVPLTPQLVETPVPTAYEPLRELARWLMAGTAGGLLVPIDRVFERYIARVVTAAFAERAEQVAIQRTTEIGGLTLRPDVTVLHGARPVAVIDAKWKRPFGQPWEPADVYQAIAYGRLLGVEVTDVIYPGRVTARRRLPGVCVWRLRVTGSATACLADATRLGRTLIRCLHASEG